MIISRLQRRFFSVLPGLFLMTLVLLTSLSGPSAQARGTYETKEDFLSRTFSASVPAPKRLIVRGDLKKRVYQILERDLRPRRVKYWQQGDRTAWILEEIGKTKPITTGLVVNRGKLESLTVLVFRESRGSEIRYPFFTEQFENITLAANQQNDQLDRHIDGISGATLSVLAMQKLARVALVLDSAVSQTQQLSSAD